MSQRPGPPGSQPVWRLDANGNEYYDDPGSRIRVYRDENRREYTLDPRTQDRVYRGNLNSATPRALPSPNIPKTQRGIALSTSPPTASLQIIPERDGQRSTERYTHGRPPNPADASGLITAFASVGLGPGDGRASQPMSERARGKLPATNNNSLRSNPASGGTRHNVESGAAIGVAANQPYSLDESKMRSVTTPKQQETLDEDFLLRKYPKKYFQIGKVFLKVHTEEYGQTGKPKQGPATTHTANKDVFPVAFGELVFSKVRRFIVVRESALTCQALAISTHSGQGARATRSDALDHGIVFTGASPPPSLKHEKGMLLNPIRVDPSDKADKLHPASRLNYGNVYTIQHNAKVKPYGIVNNTFMHLLYHQFQVVFSRNSPTYVRAALLQPPSHQTLKPLGFTDSQVNAIIAMINVRRAPPATAISSVATTAAMTFYPNRNVQQQQQLAAQTAKLVMAGLTFQQAIEQVRLVEGKQASAGVNDDDAADDVEEEGGEDDDDDEDDEDDDDDDEHVQGRQHGLGMSSKS